MKTGYQSLSGALKRLLPLAFKLKSLTLYPGACALLGSSVREIIILFHAPSAEGAF